MTNWEFELNYGKAKFDRFGFFIYLNEGKMRRITFLISIITFLFTPILSYAQELKLEKPLFFSSPTQMHKALGEAKARTLLKQRETLLKLQAPTNQDDFDALYYSLNLRVNDTTKIIYGKVDMEAKSNVNGLNTVSLDFYDNMTVDSVKMSTTSLSFSHSSNLIPITLDKPYSLNEKFLISVFYHGHPVEGGFMAFSFGTHNGYPIISSLSEPYFARTWWPCKDAPHDKADSADINITVRPDLIVASNGILREVLTNPDGTKTYKWHESYPITTYLISVAITNYAIFSHWYHYSSTDSMEVRYFVYPEYLSQAQAYYNVTVPAIEYFSKAFGQYPFLNEKYGMAHFPWGGAMEHQTCTSILYYWYDDAVIVHELAHQWWGDMITCRNWHHIWLNEGFASYCEALFFEDSLGEAYYHDYMQSMDYTGGGTIYIYDTTNVNEIFDIRVYNKGAWVLHMLRHVVGDSAFFQILGNYYSDPRYANNSAVTEDFQALCEDVYGKSLAWFFQEWIYGEYRPNYRYSWMIEPSGSVYNLFLHISQVQATQPTFFTMPIDVTVSTLSGDTTFIVFNDPQTLDFSFTLPNQPTNVQIDKDNWILKYSSKVSYSLNIVTTSLPELKTFWLLSDTLQAKGGAPPYKWSLVSGSLPDGLKLDSLSGVISGTPLVADTFSFQVQVKDFLNKIDTQDFTVAVTYDTTAPCDLVYDGQIGLSDVIFLANYILRGGPTPAPLKCGDINCDSKIRLSDVILLANYLFKSGPPPCW